MVNNLMKYNETSIKLSKWLLGVTIILFFATIFMLVYQCREFNFSVSSEHKRQMSLLYSLLREYSHNLRICQDMGNDEQYIKGEMGHTLNWLDNFIYMRCKAEILIDGGKLEENLEKAYYIFGLYNRLFDLIRATEDSEIEKRILLYKRFRKQQQNNQTAFEQTRAALENYTRWHEKQLLPEDKVRCNMTPDQYFYVYSGMTQSIGALIALVGIFIVFRLELQRNRIRDCREKLVSITHVDRFLPLKDFVSEVESYISEYKPGSRVIEGVEAGELARRYKKNIETQIESLHHTIKYGGIGIGLMMLLFLLFVAILYLHSRLPHPQSCFWITLTGSFLAVIYLIWFIYDILKKEAREYSMK